MKTAVYSGMVGTKVEASNFNMQVRRQGVFQPLFNTYNLFQWTTTPQIEEFDGDRAKIIEAQEVANNLSFEDYNDPYNLRIFGIRDIPLPDRWVDLGGLEALYPWKGGLCPDLSLLSKYPQHPMNFTIQGEKAQLGLEGIGVSHPKMIQGEFWISRKGKATFRFQENGPHFLTGVKWDHKLNPQKGMDFNINSGIQYAVRKAKTDESRGCIWFVIPTGWRYTQ